jgi:hypothetical protein
VPFQVAEHQRQAIFLGQSIQLFIKNGLDLAPGDLGGRIDRQCTHDLALPDAAPFASDCEAAADPVGDAVQPGPDRAALADGASLLRQHHEGCLKDIIRVIGVLEQPSAGAVDERTVAAHQGVKGLLILRRDETFQQYGVIRLVSDGSRDATQVRHHRF